jgi:hypothetical protein
MGRSMTCANLLDKRERQVVRWSQVVSCAFAASPLGSAGQPTPQQREVEPLSRGQLLLWVLKATRRAGQTSGPAGRTAQAAWRLRRRCVCGRPPRPHPSAA